MKWFLGTLLILWLSLLTAGMVFLTYRLGAWAKFVDDFSDAVVELAQEQSDFNDKVIEHMERTERSY